MKFTFDTKTSGSGSFGIKNFRIRKFWDRKLPDPDVFVSTANFNCYFHRQMKNPGKGEKHRFDQTLNYHNFWSIKDFWMIFFFQRKLKFWRFCWCKNFSFLMPFCNQNGIWVKKWILGFLRMGHKKLGGAWMAPT